MVAFIGRHNRFLTTLGIAGRIDFSFAKVQQTALGKGASPISLKKFFQFSGTGLSNPENGKPQG
jgi:hypothetical protein